MNTLIHESLILTIDIIKIGVLAAQKSIKDSAEKKQRIKEVKADLLNRITALKRKMLKK